MEQMVGNCLQNWIWNLKLQDIRCVAADLVLVFNNIPCSMLQQTPRREGGSPVRTSTRRRGGRGIGAAQEVRLGVDARGATEHHAR